MALWQAEGLISDKTSEILRERYAPAHSKLASFIKHLGYSGAIVLGLAILGMFATLGVEIAFLISGCLSFILLSLGIKLSSDVYGRYAYSSKTALLLGVLSLLGMTATFAHIIDVSEKDTITLMGVTNIPILLFFAYKYKNSFITVLALLALFHWIGSWHMMMGKSNYVFQIQDPQTMAVAALLSICIGVYHERNLQRTTQRLYLAYETVGLIYFNMSLLILSIYPESTATLNTAILTLAGILQIFIGSRLKNDLILGFGVAITSLNMFTRYHEFAWEKTEGSLFFLIGGSLMLLSAASIEFFKPRLQSR